MNIKNIKKQLGVERMAELEALSPESLKNEIAKAMQNIETAKAERDANENYIEAKETAKLFNSGFREVKARQNAVVQYALSLIEGKQ